MYHVKQEDDASSLESTIPAVAYPASQQRGRHHLEEERLQGHPVHQPQKQHGYHFMRETVSWLQKQKAATERLHRDQKVYPFDSTYRPAYCRTIAQSPNLATEQRSRMYQKGRGARTDGVTNCEKNYRSYRSNTSGIVDGLGRGKESMCQNELVRNEDSVCRDLIAKHSNEELEKKYTKRKPDETNKQSRSALGSSTSTATFLPRSSECVFPSMTNVASRSQSFSHIRKSGSLPRVPTRVHQSPKICRRNRIAKSKSPIPRVQYQQRWVVRQGRSHDNSSLISQGTGETTASASANHYSNQTRGRSLVSIPFPVKLSGSDRALSRSLSFPRKVSSGQSSCRQLRQKTRPSEKKHNPPLACAQQRQNTNSTLRVKPEWISDKRIVPVESGNSEEERFSTMENTSTTADPNKEDGKRTSVEPSSCYYPPVWDVVFETAERRILRKRGIQEKSNDGSQKIVVSLEDLGDVALAPHNRRSTILTLSPSSSCSNEPTDDSTSGGSSRDAGENLSVTPFFNRFDLEGAPNEIRDSAENTTEIHMVERSKNVSDGNRGTKGGSVAQRRHPTLIHKSNRRKMTARTEKMQEGRDLATSGAIDSEPVVTNKKSNNNTRLQPSSTISLDEKRILKAQHQLIIPEGHSSGMRSMGCGGAKPSACSTEANWRAGKRGLQHVLVSQGRGPPIRPSPMRRAATSLPAAEGQRMMSMQKVFPLHKVDVQRKASPSEEEKRGRLLSGRRDKRDTSANSASRPPVSTAAILSSDRKLERRPFSDSPSINHLSRGASPTVHELDRKLKRSLSAINSISTLLRPLPLTVAQEFHFETERRSSLPRLRGSRDRYQQRPEFSKTQQQNLSGVRHQVKMHVPSSSFRNVSSALPFPLATRVKTEETKYRTATANTKALSVQSDESTHSTQSPSGTKPQCAIQQMSQSRRSPSPLEKHSRELSSFESSIAESREQKSEGKLPENSHGTELERSVHLTPNVQFIRETMRTKTRVTTEPPPSPSRDHLVEECTTNSLPAEEEKSLCPCYSSELIGNNEEVHSLCQEVESFPLCEGAALSDSHFSASSLTSPIEETKQQREVPSASFNIHADSVVMNQSSKMSTRLGKNVDKRNGTSGEDETVAEKKILLVEEEDPTVLLLEVYQTPSSKVQMVQTWAEEKCPTPFYHISAVEKFSIEATESLEIQHPKGKDNVEKMSRAHENASQEFSRGEKEGQVSQIDSVLEMPDGLLTSRSLHTLTVENLDSSIVLSPTAATNNKLEAKTMFVGLDECASRECKLKIGAQQENSREVDYDSIYCHPIDIQHSMTRNDRTSQREPASLFLPEAKKKQIIPFTSMIAGTASSPDSEECSALKISLNDSTHSPSIEVQKSLTISLNSSYSCSSDELASRRIQSSRGDNKDISGVIEDGFRK